MLCKKKKQDYNKIIVQINFIYRFQSLLHANKKLHKKLDFYLQHMYFKYFQYFIHKTHIYMVCVVSK